MFQALTHGSPVSCIFHEGIFISLIFKMFQLLAANTAHLLKASFLIATEQTFNYYIFILTGKH